MSCSNNIRQLSIASLNYESTYKTMPGGGIGIYLANPKLGYNSNIAGKGQAPGRWGGMIALLPNLDQTPVYDQINSGYQAKNGAGALITVGPYGAPATAGGNFVHPRSGTYHPALTQIAALRCPSDPGKKFNNFSGQGLGRTNYAFCFGDGQVGVNSADPRQEHVRGMFGLAVQYTLAAATDGTSNTIMFGEIATPAGGSILPGAPQTLRDAKVQGTVFGGTVATNATSLGGVDVQACRALVRAGKYIGSNPMWANRGCAWMEGVIGYGGFNTINGPNGASCAASAALYQSSAANAVGIFSAASYHPGGAHVVMFDSATRLIPNEIDTSDSNANSTMADYYSPGRGNVNGWQQTPNWVAPSPFGVWGAMGTRGASETVTEQ
jgi:hypothetical protein